MSDEALDRPASHMGTSETVSERKFSEIVVQKVAKMQEKTQLVQDIFNVPQSESVIQDYRCTLKKNNNSWGGRLFITQNYMLFLSKDQQIKDSMAFYRVSGITREKTTLVIPAIGVELDTGKILLKGFVHRDETFNLLNHLINYQPTYVYLNEEELVHHIRQELSIEGKSASDVNPKDFIAKDQDRELDGRWGAFANEVKKGTVEDYEKINLKVGDDALRLAEEIKELGAETLSRMKEQAETLDRVERNVLETKNNLDRGDRIIDGVSSVGGQLKNLVTPDMYKNKLGAYEKKDRTVDVEEREDFTDVPILMKHSNDYLEPALLRFGNKRFVCVNAERVEVKQYCYSYVQVASIIMRARHQHVDIRFHDGTDRFRCCTSFVQAVVNEIVLRTKPGQVTVVHEPGTKQFQYGSLAIREQTLQASRDDTWSAEGGFFQAPKSNTTRLMTNAPEEIQDRMKKQDEQINALSGAVSDFRSIDAAIKKEALREIDQLDTIHEKTNKALLTANKDAFRAAKLT